MMTIISPSLLITRIPFTFLFSVRSALRENTVTGENDESMEA